MSRDFIQRRAVSVTSGDSDREALVDANAHLQEQALELELANQQLQDQAAEQASRATAAAEARLASMFAQAPVAIAVMDGPTHRFVLANEAYRQVVGERELMGRTVSDAFPELRGTGVLDVLDSVYRTGERFVAREFPVALALSPDAAPEKRFFDFVYEALRDDAKRVTGVVVVGTDVTDQVHGRQAAAESERQLRTFANAIPTLAWTARADGFIDWYNARWYEYTGTTPAQMAGWGWQSVHDPDALPWVLEEWRAGIATGEAVEMTFPLRGADGRFRRFLTRVTPLKDAEGRVVRWFGTNTDVEAERAARDAAERANQAKTDFLTTMSHELRTPLNAIAGYAQLLELGVHGPVTDQQRDAISRIQRAERHLLGLINDVLNFAKLTAGQVEYNIEDVEVRAAAEALETLVAPQLQTKQLRFDRGGCGDGLFVRADPDKLRQILLNLLSNAIKFTPDGGAIELLCHEDGPVAPVSVRDTGIGIAADRLDQVFDPFVQIDRRLNAPHEGTGLGLAISRDLARGMGGDLSVVSTLGEGSTFTLTLPVANATPQTAASRDG
ncbi:MAG: hypothetical protein NVS9B3_14290 [Gemmatimonadaceae bacterium]